MSDIKKHQFKHYATQVERFAHIMDEWQSELPRYEGTIYGKFGFLSPVEELELAMNALRIQRQIDLYSSPQPIIIEQGRADHGVF